jgi:hypothetical protein
MSAVNNESVGTLEQTVTEAGSQGITHFVDDSLGPTASPVQVHSGESSLIRDLDIPGAQDIDAFLKRPSVIKSGSFGVTDSGILWRDDPLKLLMASTLKLAKMKGNFMLRTDLVLTLNVNAVRFQTGRYILGFIPSGGLVVTSANYKTKFRMHTAHLTTITQTPHVEIDLGTQTHVELRIPFQSIYPYHVNTGATANAYGIGEAFLMPYDALQAASGDTTCGYTLWASMESTLLSGPTAQSSFGEKELRGSRLGPISSVASKIARASSILGEIPILAPATSMVGWSASVVGRAAQVFGWSKPVALQAPVYNAPRLLPYLQNSDQVSTAQSLGAVSTNRVVSAPSTGEAGADQMSIDYLKQIYAYFQQADWTQAMASGTLLTSWAVRPDLNVALTKGAVYPPTAFLASQFGYWRGSFKYRVKIVKNEFYSGRLLIAFNPALTSVYPADIDATEYLHRVIVDIRETAEFEFCVPYVSPGLYRKMLDVTGTVSIFVLDPLVAPSTVPTSIALLIEMAGGPDLEFARPYYDNFTYEPYAPAVSQAAEYSINPCVELGKIPPTNIRAAEVAIGEKLLALRQLVKLHKPLNPTGTITPQINGQQAYEPFARLYVGQITDNTTALLRSMFSCDQIDLFSAMYTFETGSIRVQASSNLNTAATIWYGLQDIPLPTLIYRIYTGFPTTSMRYMRSFFSTLAETFLDVNVPPYQRTIGRATAGQLYSDNATSPLAMTGPDQVNTAVVWAIQGNTDTVARPYSLSRQAGDDWNCYGFISTVPMVTTNTA